MKKSLWVILAALIILLAISGSRAIAQNPPMPPAAPRPITPITPETFSQDDARLNAYVSAPAYLHYLTDSEKAKVLAIASQARDVRKYVGSNPQIVFHWVAISASGGTIFSLGYDIVDKGMPAYQYNSLISNNMTIYPAVMFNPAGWMVSVAVDPIAEKVLFTYTHPPANRMDSVIGK